MIQLIRLSSDHHLAGSLRTVFETGIRGLTSHRQVLDVIAGDYVPSQYKSMNEKSSLREVMEKAKKQQKNPVKEAKKYIDKHLESVNNEYISYLDYFNSEIIGFLINRYVSWCNDCDPKPPTTIFIPGNENAEWVMQKLNEKLNLGKDLPSEKIKILVQNGVTRYEPNPFYQIVHNIALVGLPYTKKEKQITTWGNNISKIIDNMNKDDFASITIASHINFHSNRSESMEPLLKEYIKELGKYFKKKIFVYTGHEHTPSRIHDCEIDNIAIQHYEGGIDKKTNKLWLAFVNPHNSKIYTKTIQIKNHLRDNFKNYEMA